MSIAAKTGSAIVGATLIVGSLMGAHHAPHHSPTKHSHSHSAHLPACKTEDSTNCLWDAKKQGNGKGESFIDYHGHTYYMDECGSVIPNPCDPDSNN